MKTTSMNLDLVAGTGSNLSAGKGKDMSTDKTSGNAFNMIMNQTQNVSYGQLKQAGSQMTAKKDTPDKMFAVSQNEQSGNNKASSKSKDVANRVQNIAQANDSSVTDAYAEELKGKLKDLLGLTDEEMEELLASMGLVATDLLNPEQLVNVVLEQFNASSTADALMNEDLSSALLESSKLLEDIVSKVQEEIIDFGMADDLGKESFDKVLEGAEESEESDKNALNESDVDKSTETLGKEISVEVHKETEDGKEGFTFDREDRGARNEASGTQETFVDYFANKVDLSSIQTNEMSIQDAKQIVTQLVDQIKLNISQTKTSMEMILNPEALGKVQVVVQNKEGVLTAHLKVENELAKHALETSLQTLKESFENQGLKVEKVEVTIGNYSDEYAEQQGREESAENQGSKKKINVEDYFEDSTDTTEEVSATPIASMTGTVEYTA